MNYKTQINGVSVFWFGFDKKSKGKIELLISDFIHKGDMAFMAWETIGNIFKKNKIENITWNCDQGLIFHKL
jgi:hypothetical protein